MSTKTIPAQTIKTCDGCGVTIDSRNSRQEGKLTLNAHALDMYGHACADATRKLDLCDSCLYKVGKAIDAALAPTTQPAHQQEPDEIRSYAAARAWVARAAPEGK